MHDNRSVGSWIARRAAPRPDRTAVIFRDRKLRGDLFQRNGGDFTVLQRWQRRLTSEGMDETLTIRLDAEMAERWRRALEEEARRTNRSKGRVVRDALNAHLRESPHSALQGLAKYAGCMVGPPDL